MLIDCVKYRLLVSMIEGMVIYLFQATERCFSHSVVSDVFIESAVVCIVSCVLVMSTQL